MKVTITIQFLYLLPPFHFPLKFRFIFQKELLSMARKRTQK